MPPSGFTGLRPAFFPPAASSYINATIPFSPPGGAPAMPWRWGGVVTDYSRIHLLSLERVYLGHRQPCFLPKPASVAKRPIYFLLSGDRAARTVRLPRPAERCSSTPGPPTKMKGPASSPRTLVAGWFAGPPRQGSECAATPPTSLPHPRSLVERPVVGDSIGVGLHEE